MVLKRQRILGPDAGLGVQLARARAGFPSNLPRWKESLKSKKLCCTGVKDGKALGRARAGAGEEEGGWPAKTSEQGACVGTWAGGWQQPHGYWEGQNFPKRESPSP